MFGRMALSLAALLTGQSAAASVILDPTFSDGGRAVLPVAPAIGASVGIAVQPDDRILIAAGTPGVVVGDTTALCLARSLPDGSVDTSYGQGGTICHSFDLTAGDTREFTPAEIHVLPNNRVLVMAVLAPAYGEPPNSTVLLTRLNADGSLDTGFNAVGYAWMPYLPDAFSIDLLRVAGDRWLVAMFQAAWNFIQQPGAVSLWRLEDDGSFDPSFGEGGHAYIPMQIDSPHLVLGLPDGRFQILFDHGPLNPSQAGWRRFRENGELDTGYGIGGTQLILPWDRWFDQIHPLSDGTYIASGSFAWRLNSAGEIMGPFGTDESMPAAVGARWFPFREGRLLSVRLRRSPFLPTPRDGLYLSVFNYDGTRDMTFADDGEFFIAGAGPIDRVYTVDAPSKFIVAIGEGSTGTRRYARDFACARVGDPRGRRVSAPSLWLRLVG